MSNEVLPDKYYLSHFFELIDEIETNYAPVLEESHLDFLKSFRRLSESAQCTYVRMVNRKGQIFSRTSMSKYPEIPDINKSLVELQKKGFVLPITDNDKKSLFEFLPKTDLSRWLKKSEIRVAASESRGDLVAKAKLQSKKIQLVDLECIDDILVQGRFADLDYLLFIYFGGIQRNLTLYTLRDLGIRQARTLKNEFKARYSDLESAKIDYFFSCEIEKVGEDQNEACVYSAITYASMWTRLSSLSQSLKDKWLLTVAAKFENLNSELSLKALEDCKSHPCREKQARLLYKLGRIEDVRLLLEKIVNDPYCDEELLFAEDFYARKFDKKRIGFLTETLKNSKQITLSDVYLKRPEQGLVDYFQKQGEKAIFTENRLWLGLFGLIFWDELFNSESASLFNPFDRRPADLMGPDFYQRRQISIEKKLALLIDFQQAEIMILKTITQHYGKMNDLFQWNASLAPTTLEFLRKARYKDLAHVLRSMARRFDVYHSGYPDLMVETADDIYFVEVKADGDSLKYKQLSKARLLKDAGFNVEIIRVNWKSDPNQIYVVVDIETTGGSPGAHRITEIGAIKIQGGQIISEFQTLINPERFIPPFISKLTGITDEMVVAAPTFSGIANEFLKFTEEAIFVAHNVRFDYGFIQKEFARLEIDFNRTQLCTCQGMKKAFPGIKSYGLKNLSHHFQITMEQHHRAMSDAKAATELLLLMTGYKSPNPRVDEEASQIVSDEAPVEVNSTISLDNSIDYF